MIFIMVRKPPSYLPTPEEIKEGCAKARTKWGKRRWLTAAGVDPDRKVEVMEIKVRDIEQAMSEGDGVIDGFLE